MSTLHSRKFISITLALLMIFQNMPLTPAIADDTSYSLLKREKDKDSGFLPSYLLVQQAKHEDLVAQKETLNDLSKFSADDFTQRIRAKKSLFDKDTRRNGGNSGKNNDAANAAELAEILKNLNAGDVPTSSPDDPGQGPSNTNAVTTLLENLPAPQPVAVVNAPSNDAIAPQPASAVSPNPTVIVIAPSPDVPAVPILKAEPKPILFRPGMIKYVYDKQGRIVKATDPTKGVYTINWDTKEAMLTDLKGNVTTWANVTDATNIVDDGRISIVGNVRGYLKKEVKNPDGSVQVQLFDNQNRLIKVTDPKLGSFVFDWKTQTAVQTSADGLTVTTWTNIYDSTKPHILTLDPTSDPIAGGIKGKLYKIAQYDTNKKLLTLTTYKNRLPVEVVDSVQGTFSFDWSSKSATLSKDGVLLKKWSDIVMIDKPAADDGLTPVGVLGIRGKLVYEHKADGTEYEYDSLGRPIKIVVPGKGTFNIDWTAKVVTLTDVSGIMIIWVDITDAVNIMDDGKISIVANIRGFLKKEVLVDNVIQVQWIDNQGRPVKVIDLKMGTFDFNWMSKTATLMKDGSLLKKWSDIVMIDKPAPDDGLSPVGVLGIRGKLVYELKDGVQFEYDASGKLIKVIDPSKGTFTFDWSKAEVTLTDLKGMMTIWAEITDAVNIKDDGRITIVGNIRGYLVQYVWNSDGGGSETRLYDNQNRLVKDIHSKLGTFVFDWTANTATLTNVSGILTTWVDISDAINKMDDGKISIVANIRGFLKKEVLVDNVIQVQWIDNQGRVIKIIHPGKGTFDINWATKEITLTDRSGIMTTWADITDAVNIVDDGRISIVANIRGYLVQYVWNSDGGGSETRLYDNQNRLVKDIHSLLGTFVFDWSTHTATLTKDGALLKKWSDIVMIDKPVLNDGLSPVGVLGIRGKLVYELKDGIQYEYDASGKLIKVVDPSQGTFTFDWTANTAVLTSKDGSRVTTWMDITDAVSFADDGRDPIGVLQLRGKLWKVAEYDLNTKALAKETFYADRKIKSISEYNLVTGALTQKINFDNGLIKSITIYSGLKGSELAQEMYTFGINQRIYSIISVTQYEYANDILSKSTTYRALNSTTDPGLVQKGSVLSITFYKGVKGAELPDRMLSYGTNGKPVSTTFYFYENNVLVNTTTYDGEVIIDPVLGTFNIDWSAMTATLTSKDGLKVTTWTDITDAVSFADDGRDLIGALQLRGKLLKVSEYDATGMLKKTTLYKNRRIVSVTLFIGAKGEEVKERAFDYDFSGTTVKYTTIYAYNPDGSLISAALYRGQVNPGNENSSVRVTFTLYVGSKNRELPARIFTYNFTGTMIKTTTIFEYSTDTLVRSTLYRGNVFAAPMVTDVKISTTLYIGPAGQEVKERVFDYDFAGAMVKTTTRYEYNSDGSIKSSALYQGQVNPGQEANAIKTSVTWYQGPKGLEAKWKMTEYNVVDPEDTTSGTTRTTFYAYIYDQLNSSTTYRGDLSTEPQGLDQKIMMTTYVGPLGEEKIDTVYRFTSVLKYDYIYFTIKTVKKFEYDPSGVLMKTTLYNNTAVTTDPAKVVLGFIISRTLYTGPIGKELADRRFNYNATGTAIDTTSVYNYNTNMIMTYSPVDPSTGALLPNSVLVSSEPIFF